MAKPTFFLPIIMDARTTKRLLDDEVNRYGGLIWDGSIAAASDPTLAQQVADDVAASASAAQQSADDAALYDGPRFDTATDFFASTDTFTAGTYVRTDAEGFAYRATGTATATTVANAGGQAFEVLPDASGRFHAAAFGAMLDGVSDDTAALQKYADALAVLADTDFTVSLDATERQTFRIPQGKGAVISDTLTIGKNTSVIMDAPTLVSAAADTGKTWVLIADTSEANKRGRNLDFVIDVRRVTQSDWTNIFDVGCYINAATTSRVRINRADKFTIGVRSSLAYSNFSLGEFRSCKYGLHIVGTSFDFANQNTYVGGSFANQGGINVGKERYGIWVEKTGTGPVQGNSQTFIGPSFEMISNDGDCFPFLIDDMKDVVATSVRTEVSGPVIAKLIGDTRRCSFELLIRDEFTAPTSGLILDESTYKAINVVKYHDTPSHFLVFDSGRLADRVTYANSSNVYGLRGMDALKNYGGSGTAAGRGSQVNLSGGRPNNDGSINPNQPIGVTINTDKIKNFIVEIEKSIDPNVTMIAYDVNGNQRVVNDAILKNASTATQAPVTGTYGGSYSFGGRFAGDKRYETFTAGADTTDVFVGVDGSNISSLKIYSIGGTSSHYAFSDMLDANGRTERTPLQGDYITGQIVYYSNTAAGGSPGYYVVQGGNLGRTFAGTPTAETTEGSPVITLTDANELKAGMYINIAGVSGSFRILARQNSWARLDANADATVAAGSVSFTTPVTKDLAAISA